MAASANAATPRVELSGGDVGVRIDVSDDAPSEIELAADGVVPIRWSRGDRTRATLPWIVAAGATAGDVVINGASHAVPTGVPGATIQIDAAAYAAPWPATDARRWASFAATTALGLLLASRVPRHGTLAVVAVSTLITVGLLVYAARRPDVERREEAGVTWLRARRATVASVPIGPGDAPIVESRAHLRSLAPRVDVDREGRATLALTLNPDARVAIARSAVR